MSFSSAYERGYEVLRSILKSLLKLGVKYVSVYVMSRDNCIKRSKLELEILNALAVRGFRELREEPFVIENEVSVVVLGDLSLVSNKVREEMNRTIEFTKKFKKRSLYLALCYGAKWEIENALKRGTLPQSLNIPMIDLVIRTGGRRRLSDFLPIPASYAELYFTETLWPDFNENELLKAIKWYSTQERLFGK